MDDPPLPALVDAKRRLCGELLAAAAVHSAISDELAVIDELEACRPLSHEEQVRRINLRNRKRDALRRHDTIDHRLRRLLAHLHTTARDHRRTLQR